MDPPGTIPLFLGLTSGRHAARCAGGWPGRRCSSRSSSSCCSPLFGQQILDYLGIGFPALQGAGGLLLLLVALELLTGRADDPTETANVNVALVPLGTPLLAGPGRDRGDHRVRAARRRRRPTTSRSRAGIVAVHLVLCLSLRFTVGIIRVIKDSGIMLLTRIAGLLLVGDRRAAARRRRDGVRQEA